MDVSCPQCQTLYEFDEAQLRSVGSVNLKCSQCDHLFRLEVPEELRDESKRRWMVRKASSGDVLYFWGFDELHRWIMEGKVEERDAISRTGERWSALGTIGEFAPIFQVVASIANISRGEKAEAIEDRATQSFETSSPDAPARPRQPTHPQHAPATPAPQRAQRPTPAPQREPRPTPAPQRPPQPTPAPQRAVKPAQAPRLNLDSGRFGTGAAPGDEAPRPRRSPGRAPHLTPVDLDDDDWSLGDMSVTQSGSQLIVEELPRRKRSKTPMVAAVLLLLAVAGGVGAWQAGLLDGIVGQGAGEAVEAQATSVETDGEEASPSTGDRAIARAALALGEAVQGASRDALRPLWQEAIGEAGERVGRARETGEGAARRAHEPDLEEVLSSARRALQRGDASSARARYHRAIEIDETNPEAITGLGWALLELGESDSAVAQFRRAIYRDASHGDAYIGLGRAERDRGNMEAAIEAYETYLARHPGGAQASIARFQSEQLRRSSGR